MCSLMCFPSPPSFYTVSFPHQSAWHPTCLRNEETLLKAEKYLKKSVLCLWFQKAYVSGTTRKIRVWELDLEANLMKGHSYPDPHSLTQTGVFSVGEEEQTEEAGDHRRVLKACRALLSTPHWDLEKARDDGKTWKVGGIGVCTFMEVARWQSRCLWAFPSSLWESGHQVPKGGPKKQA